MLRKKYHFERFMVVWKPEFGVLSRLRPLQIVVRKTILFAFDRYFV